MKSLYEAINLRKSVRRYKQESISQHEMDLILKYVNEIIPIYPEIDFNIVLTDCLNQSFSLVKMVGMKVPYYISFYSEVTDDYMINAGYIMEHLSLFMISRGLGTCFVAFPSGIQDKDKDGRKLVISLAFGKADGNPYRENNRANRLSKSKICIYKEDPDADIDKLIDAAMLAPSAYNGQPWRFVVYNNRIHVFEKMNRLSNTRWGNWQDIDMGISIANMIVAAEELWIDIVIKSIDEVKEKPYKKNKYIVTIKKQS